MVEDKKTGKGFQENKDVNITILKYSDSETEFEGDLNLNIYEFVGTAKQIKGILANNEGDFLINLINE